MMMLVFGAVLGGLVVSLLSGLETIFSGVEPRTWSIVRLAVSGLAIALGVSILWSGHDTLIEIRCTITDREIRSKDVLVKVRWSVDGRRYRLREPLGISDVPAGMTPDELAERFRPGVEVPCSYRSGDPARVALGRAPDLAWRRSSAGGAFMLAGGILALAQLAAWRRGWERRGRRGGGSSGVPGILALAIAVVGMIVHREGPSALGGALIAAGALGWIVLVARDIWRADRALAGIRARLSTPRHWPAEPTEPGQWNLYADDRVTGFWKDTEVWVALTGQGAVLRARLARWPTGLSLHRRAGGEDGAVVTGDVAFDEVIRFDGPGAWWRPLIGERLRSALRRACIERGAVLDGDCLAASLPDGDTDQLAAVLDDLAAVDAAVPTMGDPHAQVLELARVEPIAEVRSAHYRWLVTEGWEVPRVLHQAAKDADAEIAAWAAAQLPPDQGAYR